MKVKTVSDNPVDKAELLGHKEIAETLQIFLESSDTITPLTIVLDGEWGTGKTSIMKTLRSKLKEDVVENIFFETWKYEYSNPSLGLITEITKKFPHVDDQRILRAAAYVISNMLLRMDSEKIVEIMRDSTRAIDNLTDMLRQSIGSKLRNKKLVIFIDDLDRCDIENSLQLLTVMKLFLDIEGVICLAGVNLKRLDQAWKIKYKAEQTEYGRIYLEKIFQIRIPIHQPTTEQVKKYLKSIIEDIDDVSLELFTELAPSNPRAIKKLVNLISYRKTLLRASPYAETSAFLWTMYEAIDENPPILFYRELRKMENGFGQLLGQYVNFAEFQKEENQRQNGILTRINNLRLRTFLDNASQLVKSISNKEQLDNDFDTLSLSSL